MHFDYENLGTSTFLVYKISNEDVIDAMSLGMLTNNKIPNFAQLSFSQMDSDKLLKYNVSSKVSAAQFFSGAVNKKRLIGVFSGIVNAMISAEDYMIDINTIILDMDYIFADVSSCDTVLVCLPLEKEESKPVDLGAFFKNIMFTTQFDQTENCDYVAKIINYLNSTPVFSLYDFKELLDNIGKSGGNIQNAAPKVVTTQAVSSPVQAVTPAPAQPVVSTPVQPVAPAPVRSVAPAPVRPVAPAPVKPQVPAPAQPVSNTTQNTKSPSDEKKMSFFYLMQHYNKENAEIYKAQKQAKKSSGTTSAVSTPVSQPVPPKNTKSASAKPANFGFAVPGQPTPVATNTSVQAPPTASATPKTTTSVKPAPSKVAVPTAPQPVVTAAPVQPAFVPREVPQGGSMNFGETTVLGGGAIGETTVLTASQAPTQMITPHLIRSKNNERISLNKPVFRIGKERSYVDYFIGDNTAISRSHANLIIREDEYFVVDTNSTNHTYVNGTMIQSGVETKISHGDKIKFANEDFEFKLY